jgi:signal peptidase I
MTTEKQSLRSRLAQPKLAWIKASVWCLLYILFVIWVGNLWWLFILPVIFDAFITQFIPWTWWKKTKNEALKSIFGWVDAILFALVAVYFINLYLFQNYQIPTSSLEKSLLVGDFLFVSKASYGPRVPNTPLSFPLVQHTFPLLNCKSFIENPQWDYKRLTGIDTIKRNDIVVFNFPTGDTVIVNSENPDYYTQCYEIGLELVKNGQYTPGGDTARQIISNSNNYDLCTSIGRRYVYELQSQNKIGGLVYRPVDRRENYVKRCVAVAGDWMKIVDNQVYVNDKPQEKIPGIQFNYFVQTDGNELSEKVLDKLSISREDRMQVTDAEAPYFSAQNKAVLARYLGMDESKPIYRFPMNEETKAKMQEITGVQKIKIVPAECGGGNVFPLGGGKKWTRDNYGPLYIPRKGAILKLNAYNLPIYERIIRVYEHNKLEVKRGKYFINGQQTNSYQFKMNYYWMMGDNRHNSADSRYWGFVPEDHVVGRPVFVWLSLDKDKSVFDGKIRWNRFLKNAEQ